MTTSDEKTVRTLRAQAWARAKGELEAVLVSYWGEMDKYRLMNELVEKFIKTVEDEGLAE